MEWPTDGIACSVDSNVLYITFSRESALNAFTTKMYAAIGVAIKQAEAQADIDIVVLSGSGRAFGVGGDIGEIVESVAKGDEEALMRFLNNNPAKIISETPLVTIALVDGLCYGGGLIIASVCDIVLASDKATFCLPEARIGIAEGLSVSSLLSDLGPRALKYMLYTGRRVCAHEALRIDLVSEVVEGRDLRSYAQEVIEAVRSTDRGAREAYKRMIGAQLPKITYESNLDLGIDLERLASVLKRR